MILWWFLPDFLFRSCSLVVSSNLSLLSSMPDPKPPLQLQGVSVCEEPGVKKW